MEDLPNSNLQLVLGVKEGSNFDRIQKPTAIIATLNGHCRESKKIQSDCNPQYATDLTWDTDKNALRKMRCNQTPVKIECYAVNDNGSREKVGYTLLSVRSAQIILQGKESSIRTNWHDILGIRNDFSSCRPKLLLYLIIKGKKDGNPERPLPVGIDPHHQVTCINVENMPVWLEEEHLIQLGPSDTCRDIFLFSIIAMTANNLLDPTLKPFESRLSDSLIINERIIVRMRTSLPVLMNYLKTTPHFFVRLKMNGTFVGQSEVNLKSLIETSYLQNSNKKSYDSLFAKQYFCVLKGMESKGIEVDKKRGEGGMKTAGLEIHIKLQHVKSSDVLIEEDLNKVSHNPPQRVELRKKIDYSEKRINLGVPPCRFVDPETCHVKMSHLTSNEKLIHPNENIQFQCLGDFTNNLNSFSEENLSKPFKTYRNFCLNVHLEAIKFFDPNPELQKIEFRFYQPQGEIITTICSNISVNAGKMILLKDIKCKLYFITTAQEIEETLAAFCPRINVCNACSSEKKCLAQVYLDIKKLFFNQEHSFEYEAPMIDCHNKKKIGCISTAIILSEHTAPVSKDDKNESIQDENSPDNRTSVLESWKEEQKRIFLRELQKKEKAHLTLLHQEWKRRRECLESKLTHSVQQCKLLADNLNTMTENLKKYKIQSLEKESKLLQTNQELQWKYDCKLQELQNKLQEMHKEFTSQLTSLEQQNKNLVTQINALLEKRLELEKTVSEQTDKIRIFEKAALNEDQTATVFLQLKSLEEKIEEAQKSKSFFKEQWANSVRELHRMQIGNQQNLHNQIENNRKELDNINLERILSVDSAALTHDQVALSEIQREIDSMNPELVLQRLQFDQNDQSFAPLSDLCLNWRQSNLITKNQLSSDCMSIENL